MQQHYGTVKAAPAGRRRHLLRLPVVLPDPGAGVLRRRLGRPGLPRRAGQPGRRRSSRCSRASSATATAQIPARRHRARRRDGRADRPGRRRSTPGSAGSRRMRDAPRSWSSSCPRSEQPNFVVGQAPRPGHAGDHRADPAGRVAVTGIVSGFSDDLLDLVGLEHRARRGWCSCSAVAGRPGSRTRCSSSRCSGCSPAPHLPRRALWQGALLGAVGFEVLKQVSSCLLRLHPAPAGVPGVRHRADPRWSGSTTSPGGAVRRRLGATPRGRRGRPARPRADRPHPTPSPSGRGSRYPVPQRPPYPGTHALPPPRRARRPATGPTRVSRSAPVSRRRSVSSRCSGVGVADAVASEISHHPGTTRARAAR